MGASTFRALPFPYNATLTAQGGAVVATGVRCAVWPASRRASEEAGGQYTHEGEAEAEFYEDLAVQNRSLVIVGVGSFKIIEAILMPLPPQHVALLLRSTRPGG